MADIQINTFAYAVMHGLWRSATEKSGCAIICGTKKIEYRELKQTTLNKYTYLDETDGKRYLRRYDALRLFVGYNQDRESALVQVTDITYNEGVVEYHLGIILDVVSS